MPDSRTLLPAPKLLDLIGIRCDANVITLAARTSSRVARCPACGERSARVHSRYTRTLADLPWQGIPVTIRLRVRRFFCEEANCHRAIFAERLPGLAAHYARRTERLDGWFTHVSFALGGSEHPGVEVVSRDRSGEYAEGAKRAAPHALQVADRFHLLKN